MTFCRLILRPLLGFLLAAALAAGLALAWMHTLPTTGAAGEAWRMGGAPLWPVPGADRTDTRAESKGPYLKNCAKHVRNPHQENRGDCKQ